MAKIDDRGLTAAELTTQDPVVPFGVIIIEKDTGKGKLGNGGATWTDLPYWIDPSAVTAGNVVNALNLDLAPIEVTESGADAADLWTALAALGLIVEPEV
jgi:hypothetical protein